MHAFDRSLALRVLAATSAAVAATASVVVATDEAGSTLGMRLARLASFGPAATGMAVLAVSAHARARGETASLAALGAPPWVALRGAAWGGLLGGVVAVLVLLSPWTDPSSLFPAVHRAIEWKLDGLAGVAHATGVSVTSKGVLALNAEGVSSAPFAPGPATALTCIGPLAVIVPPWAVTPMSAPVRVASVGLAASSAVVLLHAVAAGLWPSLALILPALPLVTALGWSRRRRA